MSTRSYICIETTKGIYKGIYCHSDGYLTYNGAMLFDYYQDREKVEHLISLGNMSCLMPKLDPDPTKPHSFDYNNRQNDVCVFYGRDRGEVDQEAKEISLKALADDPWIEYVYVYGLDNIWRYFEYSDMDNMKPVEKGLEEEFKRMGIERPKDVYGYYTKDDTEKLKNHKN